MTIRTGLARAAAVACVALVAACGGDDDGDDFGIDGLYEVSHHTFNNQGCAEEGPDADQFTHFQLVADQLLGQPFLSFGACTSADPTTCDDGGLFDAYFRQGGMLIQEASVSSGGGDFACFLSHVTATLSSSGDTVTIERFSYRDEDDTLSEDACDPDEAADRGTAMPCDTFEVIEGALAQ